MIKKIVIFLVVFYNLALCDYLLINMDLKQKDHLRAYGVVYWSLQQGFKVRWLLNYRGGSFLCPDNESIANRCYELGVSFEKISGSDYSKILATIEQNNMDVMELEKAPRIAVYTPPNSQPWDDAVTLVLDYIKIKYDKIFDEEVLNGVLENYDWLHLHHEDFTGQYGKFWATYGREPWYINQQLESEKLAHSLGFKKVSKLKLAVVEEIRRFVLNGGFLFAMCSATETFDVALAARNTDICDTPFDHDPIDPNYKAKLKFDQCFAFYNFSIYTNPYVYKHSSIDTTPDRGIGLKGPEADAFKLFDFSAKFDPIPTMLTQDHTSIIKGFMGQTTAFYEEFIKPYVVILGKQEGTNIVKYIYGNIGKGFFAFLGGHDPEDYRHFVGDPPTDLSLYKNSPGYRLILNNILFPAAKKKKLKT